MGVHSAYPAGVTHLEAVDTTETDWQFGLDRVPPNWRGFRDNAGNLVFFGENNSNEVVPYWSADEGATWTASTAMALSVAVLEFSRANWMFFPETGYCFATSNDSGSDTNMIAVKWDSTAKTLTYLTADQLAAGSGTSLGDAVGYVKATDASVYVLVAPISDDGASRLATVEFETDTDTFGTALISVAAVLGTHGRAIALTAHDSDKSLKTFNSDHTTESVWVFGHNGTKMRVIQLDWSTDRFDDGANTPFDCFDGVQTGYIAGVGFSPIDNCWYAAWHTNTPDMKIFKSSGADPSAATWTLVSTYSTDDGTVTLQWNANDGHSHAGYSMAFNPAANKFYAVWFDNVLAANKLWKVVYDCTADTWTHEDIGWVDADFDSGVANTDYLPFPIWPWRGDTSEYDSIHSHVFQIELDVANDDHSFFLSWDLGGAGAFIGWGIPMGIA